MSNCSFIDPLVTPYVDGELAGHAHDAKRFVRHCQWLLSQDVGLAVFATNSEGNPLTVVEKIGLLDTLVGAGLPPERMMPGTGTCALGDTVDLKTAKYTNSIGTIRSRSSG